MGAETAATINPKDLIEGLGKGLRVIEAFDADHTRLSASEAAVLAGITRTAARRHLLTLVHYGYAATDGKQFWLAPRVLRLGQSYLGSSRLSQLVQPFIQRISVQCGETVNVSVLDGHEVVYVARSTPPRYVSIGYQVGMRVPAHVVTPGIVILATMPGKAIDTWVREHDFASFTSHTVTDAAHFREEIREAREQDYWATLAQLDPTFGGISQALRDHKGVCRGAIGMTVLGSQYTTQTMAEKLLPLLREAAQTLRPLL